MLHLPDSWQPVVGQELIQPYFQNLQRYLEAERAAGEVFPPEAQVFEALRHTPFAAVKAVILGQDPYHGAGQAHGLAFSVPPGIKWPPSLVNIFKELRADLDVAPPANGSLISWANKGVLLLNTVLTVRAHEAHSHRNQGWEIFTDKVLTKLNERAEPVIFVLWGTPAGKKKQLLDPSRHAILEAPHPSPLSAHRGFLGSRPFSTINRVLQSWGRKEIDWRITD